MGLFRREARSITAGEVIARINQMRANPSAPVVTNETAMRHSAVWACHRLIAGVGSTLPLDVFRNATDGAEPVGANLYDRPDPSMTSSSWRYQLWSSLLGAGNSYALLGSFKSNGWPGTAPLLDPGVVAWTERYPGREGEWVTTVGGKVVERWPNGPLWHTPLFLVPGKPYGMSPIEAARVSIGTGLEAEKFGSEFFTGGGHPSSIVYSESELTSEQASAIKDAWLKATQGREPAVLGAGLKFDQIQISPTDSQFLDTQRFTVEQVARIYGVFPEMIGGVTSGQNVTYSNREQRAGDWLTYGLLPYLVPIEESMSALVPRPQRVKHNVSGVLRSDLKTRYESYEIASRIAKNMGAPLLNINEMRDFEDLAPVSGGDTFTPPPPPPAPVAAPVDSGSPPT